MKYTLRAGTRLDHIVTENNPIELLEDTEVEFVGADTMDVIAERMAANRNYYALHRGELTHEEEGERVVEGERRKVKIKVTYGINGEREETIGDALTINEVQSRSVKVDGASDAKN